MLHTNHAVGMVGKDTGLLGRGRRSGGVWAGERCFSVPAAGAVWVGARATPAPVVFGIFWGRGYSRVWELVWLG